MIRGSNHTLNASINILWMDTSTQTEQYRCQVTQFAQGHLMASEKKRWWGTQNKLETGVLEKAGDEWIWYIYIYILYYTIWVCIYLYIGIWCLRHDIVLWSMDHQLVWNSPISNMLPSGETHAPHFELHWSIPPQPNPAKWSWGIGHGIDTLRLPAFSQESLFSTFSAWFWGIICREGVHNTGLSTATATPKQQYIYIYI